MSEERKSEGRNRLRERRGSRVLDAELVWLAEMSEGEMGKRGQSYEPSCGGTKENDGISDNEVDAATKEKRIRRALAELDGETQRILIAAHACRPRIRFADLGEMEGVAIELVGEDAVLGLVAETKRVRRESESRDAWSTAKKEARETLQRLRASALRRVATAVAAFREERRAQAATERSLRDRRHAEYKKAMGWT